MKREKTPFRCWPVLPMALIVLLPLFASCDQLGEDSGNKTKTAVEFSLGEIAPWSATTELRGGSETPRVVETASVPLADNWVLEASWVEDPVAPTRAIAGLNDGAVIHIIARHASTSAITEGNYNYQDLSGKIVPDDQPIKLEDGSYYFTAYSYNTSAVTLPGTLSADYPNSDVTLSPYDATSTSLVGNDLLLSTTPSGNPVTKSGNTGINLGTLKHQFSRVIYATGSVTGTPTPTLVITGVKLSPNYTAKLTKSNDAFTVDAQTTDQPLSSTGYSYVYTPTSLFPTLKISGTINSTPFTDVPVTYTKTLAPGKSYTLRINIMQGLPWAGSNIYWVEMNASTGAGYLTFAAPGTTDKQFYQGVFFRWGSLVGVSPVQTSSSDNFSTTATPIYVPVDNVNKGSITWKRTNLTAARSAYSWNTQQFFYSYYDFDYIPAVNTGTAPDPADNYLASSGVHAPSSYKGDICKYLTGQPNVPAGEWVMPTRNDFADIANTWTTDIWTTIPSTGDYWYRKPQSGGFTPNNAQTGTNSDGTYHGWDWGASYCNSTTVFPASGARGPDAGVLHNNRTGINGDYWSSSAHHVYTDYSYSFFFNSDGVIPDSTPYRGAASSVRCVLQH
jgi:hypothetical protein